MIVPAIKGLVQNIIELGALYGMTYNGASVAALAADYEVTVTMEDAVLEDSQTKLNKGIILLTNGLLSKKTIMTDPKYGLGMTDEEADAELAQIANERKITAGALDLFSMMSE